MISYYGDVNFDNSIKHTDDVNQFCFNNIIRRRIGETTDFEPRWYNKYILM